VAAFTFLPAAPQVMQTVTFDASTTTNNTTACGTQCTYAWNFGDGTTASGITTTHQYRSIGSFVATLTVTDSRGATATRSQTIAVAAGTPPTMTAFTTSPTSPGVNQDIFFNASASATPAAGRTITGYEWLFGDGNSGRGVIVTHRYTAPGQYTVQLAATDDAGSIGRITQTLQVGPVVGARPTAVLTFTPGSPKAGAPVSFNASTSLPGTGANIQSYTFNWGDGSPEDVVTNPLQTHTYTAAGTFVATVTVTDTLGRTAQAQVTVTVVP
jgi:PKD repeat protein